MREAGLNAGGGFRIIAESGERFTIIPSHPEVALSGAWSRIAPVWRGQALQDSAASTRDQGRHLAGHLKADVVVSDADAK
jgi:hypothetical protein